MKPLLSVLLMCAAATAAPPAFQLGVSYSEWLPAPASNGIQLATDNSGAVYFLTSVIQSNVALSTVTKLTPDGKTVVWQNQLGFSASIMAVDPNGGVYVVPAREQSDTVGYVAKLSSTGIGLAWKTSVGFLPQQAAPPIVADSQGRVYLAAQYKITNFITRNAYVVRLNAAGSAVDITTEIAGTPVSIAVDSAGTVYVAGTAVNTSGAGTGFLAQVGVNGTPGYYTVLPEGTSEQVAVDAAGNVTLFASGMVQRIDATGAVALKTTVAGATVAYALDRSGNAYVAAVSNRLYPVRNSLAPCRLDPSLNVPGYSQLLNVIAPDGSTLQATYIPGGDNLGTPRLALTPNDGVLVTATAGQGFTPTQTGPFAAGTAGSLFLSKLTPAAGSTDSLACGGSSASLIASAISPGELFTLSGNGLGPQQGVQAQGSFPTKLANVQVTVGGIPAPLLWVQDSQINLVAPWSLVPGTNTSICVSYNNVTTNCLTWPVVQTAPAVFTVDGVHAAALNQDGTYNSAANPAAPGSIVTVYATGLGPITPSQPDGGVIGNPLPVNQIAFGVQAVYTLGIPFGNQIIVPFEVLYAGPAPTLVGGVSQINFRVAAFPSYGSIYLYSGSVSSPGFSVFISGQ